MGLFSIFKTDKKNHNNHYLQVDVHSHLIYGVDDGAKTLDDSIELITKMKNFGVQKIITTPHIMNDFYKNSKDILFPKRDEIINKIHELDLNVQFECAAEYYLDEGFKAKLNDKNNLLTIEEEYVLVETSYMNKPVNLFQLIFDIQSAGFKPIIAHPERYIYFHESFENYIELFEKNVYFQVNVNSLSGYYSKSAKQIAEKLIDKNMVHFFGSDCHSVKHIEAMQKAIDTKHFSIATQNNLLNNTLL